MDDKEQCREAFEEWASLCPYTRKGTNHDLIGWYYFDDATNDKWEAYQAAWNRRAPVPQANADRVDALKLRLHQVDSAAHKLAARLTMIATAKTLRGNDLIRREDAMELVVQWRREWDAAVTASKTTSEG